MMDENEAMETPGEENQENPGINPRRGMKDNWPPAVNPGKSGGESPPAFNQPHSSGKK